MKTFATYTLGCKVNQYETQAIEGMFLERGYRLVPFDEKADLYIINTCTVTHISDRKSRQMIRHAKKTNPSCLVVVTGCYAQVAPQEIAAIEGVALVCGTNEKNQILELIARHTKGSAETRVGNIMRMRSFESMQAAVPAERFRAYIKIQEGCSEFCTYCIIPYARGPIRSRSLEEIRREAEFLAGQGVREVILTGIHVAAYGKDFKDGTDLLHAIEAASSPSGICRVRLSSIEPMKLTREFAKSLRQYPKLCPHFHLSLQSGCDETLRRMNRKYTCAQYREIAEGLRNEFPDAAVTTDIMVGFPGETDEEFMQSYRFAQEIAFAQMHVFPYSRRRGTKADRMENQIPDPVKEERSHKMLELDHICRTAFLKQFLGRDLEVLFEREKNGFLDGKAPNYLTVRIPAGEGRPGEIKWVHIEAVEQGRLFGHAI